MAPPKIQFVGASCGKHGSHTFYKAFKFLSDENYRILTLGEFFFLKISHDSPVCIGELQLLWENQSKTELLCSVRLYFLPENTPEGKQEFHGEDEILSISEKLILKLEDLVTLIVDHVEWTAGREPYQMEEEKDQSAKRESPKLFPSTTCKFSLTDVQKERQSIGDFGDGTSTDVIILSYPQYCRYRGILKRLENVADKWLKSAIVRAIGGITSPHSNSRILFCRDTFDHPDIDDFELRCDHLAPNLKGRPRKKRSTTQDSNQDSDETSSERSTSTPPVVKVKIGKRVSALRNGYRFDKDLVSKDEQSFLFSLHKFMKKRNTPINRIPSLGFQQIDLYLFYTYAEKIGGYDQISSKRLWKHLYDKLGGDPSSTSAATCTRRHYEKLLWPYEKHVKGHSENSAQGLKRKKARLLAKAREEARNRLKTGKKGVNGESNKYGDIKKKFKDRTYIGINLHEKVKQWEHIRKLKAYERDKIKKAVSHPKTVKNLLDHSALKDDICPKVKLERIDIKTEEKPKENKVPQNTEKSVTIKTDVKEKVETTSGNPKPINSVSHSQSYQSNGESKTSVKQEKVQLEVSAKTPDHKHSSVPSPGFLPFSPTLPLHPAAMFYPPFMHMGAVSPLGLPVMHHLPMSMPPFMPPSPTEHKHMMHSKTPKAAATQPLSSSSSSSSSTSSKLGSRSSVVQQHSQATTAVTYTKSSDHKSHQSIPGSPGGSKSPSGSCLMTPPAHMNGLKRPYSATPISHIPSPYRPPFANKSLLFDFESPKRPKVENGSNSSKSVSDTLQDNDQPTDLSMKTLRKLESCTKQETKKENGSKLDAIDLRCYSPLVSIDSPQDLSKKSLHNSMGSSKSSVSLHSSVPRTDLSSNVFKKSKPSVFNPVSHVFSKESKPHSRDETSSSKMFQDSKSESNIKISSHSPLTPDPSGIVHPAFPHFVPPFPVSQHAPTFLPTPQQMQQLYQAQIRATAAQAHAFEEMMQRSRFGVYPTMPFVPQSLYTHAHKEKSHKHAK